MVFSEDRLSFYFSQQLSPCTQSTGSRLGCFKHFAETISFQSRIDWAIATVVYGSNQAWVSGWSFMTDTDCLSCPGFKFEMGRFYHF